MVEVTSFEQATEVGAQAIKVQDVPTIHAMAAWLAEHGGERGKLLALYYEGVAALYVGDLSTAVPRLTETMALATEMNDVAMMANVLTALGNIGLMQGDYAMALEHYGRSIDLHAARNNKQGMGLAYRQRGGVLMFLGKWPEALEELTRALAVDEEMGDTTLIGQTLNSLGTLYSHAGDITSSVDHHFRALRALEDANSPNDVAFTYGQLGNAYAMHGEVDRAVEHFKRALQYYEETGSKRDCVGVYGNIGLTFLNNGRADEAEPYLLRSCTLARELGAMHECAFFTEAYGQALFALDRIADCRALLDREQDMFSRFADVSLLTEVLRAKLLIHDGDMTAARTMLEQTLQSMQSESMAQHRLMVHEQLQGIAKQQADFEAYLTHDAAIKAIREEREGKETTQKIAFQEKQREMELVQREHQMHLTVLHSALPKHIADRVARGEVVQDHFERATVLFADLVGFTTMSSTLDAEQVVAMLDKIFGRCDDVVAQHGLFKIKTIGDSYMAVSFEDACAAARAAVDIMEAITTSAPELQCRIGLHCGPVVAGIIGSERMQYDVWGDTVNVASRMESSGLPGRIHISDAMADELRRCTTDVDLEPRGEINVKGKGTMSTFWLQRIATVVVLSLLAAFNLVALNQQVVDSLNTVLAHADHDTTRIKAWNALAREYWGTNTEKATALVRRSMQVSERIGYTAGYAEACRVNAGILTDLKKYSEALEWNHRALEKFRVVGDSAKIYNVYFNFGIIYLNIGDHEKSLKYNFDCLAYYERTGNEADAAGLYHNISITYVAVGNVKEAFAFLKKAQRINQRTGNRDWEARNWLNLASLNDDRDRAEALRSYGRARDLFLVSGDTIAYGMALVGIAIVRAKLGDLGMAIDTLHKALPVFRAQHDMNGIAWTYNQLGNCYTLQKRFAEAAVCLDSCLRLCKQLHSTDAMRNVYQRLFELDTASGNRAAAFFHYRDYITARDSIDNGDKVRAVANQVMRFQFSQQEAKTKAEQEKKDITQRNIRNSIAAGVVLALGFLVVVYRQRNRVEREKKRSESLLLNILPAEVASELMTRGETSARRYDNVTVLFTDFVDFTKIGEGMRPEDLVQELHECFSAFDAIIERNGLEKIKTTGDAYMAVCGMPAANEHHAEACVRAALEILAYVHHRTQQGKAFQIRIGIHSGSVVAGIVGVKKFAYDIWGDVVNTAARMEQHSMPGKITISESTYQLVHDRFICTPRGKVAVKGKGEMEMYFVEERR